MVWGRSWSFFSLGSPLVSVSGSWFGARWKTARCRVPTNPYIEACHNSSIAKIAAVARRNCVVCLSVVYLVSQNCSIARTSGWSSCLGAGCRSGCFVRGSVGKEIAWATSWVSGWSAAWFRWSPSRWACRFRRRRALHCPRPSSWCSYAANSRCCFACPARSRRRAHKSTRIRSLYLLSRCCKSGSDHSTLSSSTLGKNLRCRVDEWSWCTQIRGWTGSKTGKKQFSYR